MGRGEERQFVHRVALSFACFHLVLSPPVSFFSLAPSSLRLIFFVAVLGAFLFLLSVVVGGRESFLVPFLVFRVLPVFFLVPVLVLLSLSPSLVAISPPISVSHSPVASPVSQQRAVPSPMWISLSLPLSPFPPSSLSFSLPFVASASLSLPSVPLHGRAGERRPQRGK